MKKDLVVFGFLILIGVSVFVGVVSAKMDIKEDGSYEVSVSIEKGWNLVSGIVPDRAILPDSEIVLSDISVVWYYSPIQRKYIRIYPDMEKEKLDDDNDDYVLSNAMWIYSNKAGLLKYSTLGDYRYFVGVGDEEVEYNSMKRKLYAGWNFISVTPDFAGKNLEELKGTCEIEKAYVWDSDDKDWNVFMLDNSIEESGIGYGFVMKVSDDCVMGEDSGSVGPPVLPGVEDDGVLIRKDFPPFYYREEGKNVMTHWTEDCDLANRNDDVCDYYTVSYDYNGEGMDYIQVIIEEPSRDFSFNDAVRNLKSEVGEPNNSVIIDDEYWNGNFYWSLVAGDGDVRDAYLVWKSNDKLIVILFSGFNDSLFDDEGVEPLVNAYFNKYPSTSSDENDGPM